MIKFSESLSMRVIGLLYVRRALRFVGSRAQNVRFLWNRFAFVACTPGLRLHMAGGQRIHKSAKIQVTDGGVLSVGGSVDISRGVEITAKGSEVSIGEGTFIGPWSTIVGRKRITLGRDCLIAERVTIRDQDHDISGPSSLAIRDAGFRIAEVKIGNGVWIGAGAVVLKGVSIGDGAVIGANSVVNRDVGERQIVAGVPARLIGVRENGSDGQ